MKSAKLLSYRPLLPVTNFSKLNWETRPKRGSKDNPTVIKMELKNPNQTNNLEEFGPIKDLLLDEDITEIMVNGPNQVYCERKGKVELTAIHFRDNEHILAIIKKIVAKAGLCIDEATPVVNARLIDGLRINALIPPLSIMGPFVFISREEVNT